MKTSVVLTLIGTDRPGIVERLADTLAAHDGNWLESRMARLAGQFAGILCASVPRDRADELIRALDGLAADGLQVVVRRSDDAVAGGEARALTLELVGADHEGIVRDVSRALAGQGINVEHLATECSEAPMSGDPLFRATARLQVPAGVSLEQLERTLEELANDLMVDLQLDELS